MSDLGLLLFAFAAGCIVAGVYLALLWAGVRSLTGMRHVGAFLFLSVLRAGLVVAALALAIVMQIGAGGIMAGLTGFVTVRIVATRRLDRPRKEVG